MLSKQDAAQDVMQVCRNGHVITDRLHSDPESGRFHCDRCGASTLDHCMTCGLELPGVKTVDSLVPIGMRPAPRFCQMCGAAFPWVRKPCPGPQPLALLEGLLRRLPLVIRQLRWRQTDQPPYRVENERDLEDLLRALLPLHFDDVRLEGRTPRYSPGNRTDLTLAKEGIAIAAKYILPGLGEPQLKLQCTEDAAYYRARGGYKTLIVCIYDPEGLLPGPQGVESMMSECGPDLDVRCIVCCPQAAASLPR